MGNCQKCKSKEDRLRDEIQSLRSAVESASEIIDKSKRLLREGVSIVETNHHMMQLHSGWLSDSKDLI